MVALRMQQSRTDCQLQSLMEIVADRPRACKPVGGEGRSLSERLTCFLVRQGQGIGKEPQTASLSLSKLLRRSPTGWLGI